MQHRLGAEGDVVVGRRAATSPSRTSAPPWSAGRARRRGCRSAACRWRWCRSRRPSGSGCGGRRRAAGSGWLRLQRHQFGLGIGGAELVLQLGDARRRVLGEELRAEIDERRVAPLHVLVGGDQVARLQVVGAEAEDRGGDLGSASIAGMPGWRSPSAFSRALNRAWVTKLVSAEHVGALEHRDRLLALQRRGDLGLGERLEQLDGDRRRPSCPGCAGRAATARTSSVTEPRPIITVSASSQK